MIPANRWTIAVLLGLLLAGCRNEAGSRESWPPLVPAEQLTRTDVLPHLDGVLTPDRDYVYCATFQLAWDELAKGPAEKQILIDDEPELAKALNAEPFDRANLRPESYLAMAGRTDEGIVNTLRAEMRRRFPEAALDVPDPPPTAAICVYAYLAKTLAFPGRFDRLAEPLEFGPPGNTVRVKAFGTDCFSPGTELGDARCDQVTVLDYRSDDDFILSLKTTTASDRIVLAKVQPEGTLRGTIQAVQARIQSASLDPWLTNPADGECLRVPIIAVGVKRSYGELVGRQIVNRECRGLPILMAEQTIRFRLDESGAKLESSAGMAASEAAAPHQPRQFVFDRPFLVYLEESSGTAPYFAIWVGSADLLEK